MNDRSLPLEFLVIGGGPAGSAAAIALAERGRKVLLVEQSDYRALRIGETLPPAAKSVLARLGLDFESSRFGHLNCPGTVSIWGSDIPYFNDFLFDSEGDGLHVDRASFDVALVRRAEAAGASVTTGARVRSCRRDRTHWNVTIRIGGESRCLQATTLIDAAGRRPWPGRPSQRMQFDRQVAIVTVFDLKECGLSKYDQRTWIEASSRGWWYSSVLPDDRLIAAYFTDADLLDATRQSRCDRWAERLSEARYTSDRLRGTRPLTCPRPVAASSTIALPVAAPGYIAVGDAASTVDPLSSHGILYALTSGLAAADALTSTEPERAVAAYSETIDDRFHDDLDTRSQFCRAEKRWPDSPFWRRRAGHSASPVQA